MRRAPTPRAPRGAHGDEQAPPESVGTEPLGVRLGERLTGPRHDRDGAPVEARPILGAIERPRLDDVVVLLEDVREVSSP